MSKEYYYKHREELLKQKRQHYLEHREELCKKSRDYHHSHKNSVSKSRKKRQEKYPWKFTLYNIKTRCNNPKGTEYNRYGGRGIKCLITEEELKVLWFRDKAYEMDWPSIDRRNNNGDYTFENCRYIEFKFNRKNKRKTNRPILQVNRDGIIIKEWESLTKAAKHFNVSIQGIFNAINHKRNTYFCKGYMWRYKND